MRNAFDLVKHPMASQVSLSDLQIDVRSGGFLPFSSSDLALEIV